MQRRVASTNVGRRVGTPRLKWRSNRVHAEVEHAVLSKHDLLHGARDAFTGERVRVIRLVRHKQHQIAEHVLHLVKSRIAQRPLGITKGAKVRPQLLRTPSHIDEVSKVARCHELAAKHVDIIPPCCRHQPPPCAGCSGSGLIGRL